MNNFDKHAIFKVGYSEANSRKIQELLFELGYLWGDNHKSSYNENVINRYKEFAAIQIERHKFMHFGDINNYNISFDYKDYHRFDVETNWDEIEKFMGIDHTNYHKVYFKNKAYLIKNTS